MNASDHIAEAELTMEIVRQSVAIPSENVTRTAEVHALIAIAQSLDRLADQGDIRISRAER